MSVNPDLFDLTMSDEARPLLDRVKKHIQENVVPIVEEYDRLGEEREHEWEFAPGQLELLAVAKQKAKESGLWNFFLPTLPESAPGIKLSNLEYAPLAEIMGRVYWGFST